MRCNPELHLTEKDDTSVINQSSEIISEGNIGTTIGTTDAVHIGKIQLAIL